MKISNETKVGILAIVAIIILIFGYNYLKGKDLFSTDATFFAIYDRIDGLATSNPVQINGFQIGMVEDIYLKPDRSGKLVVKFTIDKEVNLPKDAKVKIVSSGLLGDKAVEVDLGKARTLKGLQYAESGDTLQGIIELGITELALEELMPIKDKVENMLTSLDSTLIEVKLLMRSNEFKAAFNNLGEVVNDLKGTLDNMNELTGSLNDFAASDLDKISVSLSNFQSASGDLKQLTAGLNGTKVKFDKVLDNTNTITQKFADIELEKMVAQTQTALAQVNSMMASIEAGEGTVGKVLKDENLYNNLEDTAESLNRLLVDFQQNPKDYVSFSLISIGGGKKKAEKEAKKKAEEEAKKKAEAKEVGETVEKENY
ncbi:MAG: MlaD family protein [Chitinophagales bacterium]